MKKTSAKLTAEEYVKLLSVSPLQLSGGRVIVTGNVDLVKIPGGRKVRHLTSAEIHGKVIADKTCSLQTIRSCEIWGRVEVSGSRLEETSPDSKFLGSFYATGCPRLKTIAGEFSGDVDLSRSSVEEVPSIAYFKRNLWLEGCRHLRLVDCRVNGSLDASRSSLAVVGPRCRVRCGVFLSSCENLSEIGCIGNPEHLLLDGSAIRRLGPEFRCRQSISMRNCRALEKLPVLTAEEVTITSSQICALVTEPPNQFIIVEECPRLRKLSVSPQQKLFVRECPVADLRGVSKNVKTLEVSACPRLSDLSTDWRGNILLSHLPSLKQIPPSKMTASPSVADGILRPAWVFLKSPAGVFSEGGTQGTFFRLGSDHAAPATAQTVVRDKKLLEEWFLEGRTHSKKDTRIASGTCVNSPEKLGASGTRNFISGGSLRHFPLDKSRIHAGYRLVHPTGQPLGLKSSLDIRLLAFRVPDSCPDCDSRFFLPVRQNTLHLLQVALLKGHNSSSTLDGFLDHAHKLFRPFCPLTPGSFFQRGKVVRRDDFLPPYGIPRPFLFPFSDSPEEYFGTLSRRQSGVMGLLV